MNDPLVLADVRMAALRPDDLISSGASSSDVEIDWRQPPSAIHLSAEIVHVWRARLGSRGGEGPAGGTDVRSLVLSQEEQLHANRYRFEIDRERFAARRSILRQVLGRYLGCEPDQLSFRCNEFGKPMLGQRGGDWLRFSTSHSEGLAVIAVAAERDVGIDVEWIGRPLDVFELARHYFAPGETAFLESLRDEARRAAFFRLWTAKEAYVKAVGMGLSLPVAEVEVDVCQPLATEYHSILGSRLEARQWSLCPFVPDDGFTAALAVRRASLGIAV